MKAGHFSTFNVLVKMKGKCYCRSGAVETRLEEVETATGKWLFDPGACTLQKSHYLHNIVLP
jgi:hypothetical protein